MLNQITSHLSGSLKLALVLLGVLILLNMPVFAHDRQDIEARLDGLFEAHGLEGTIVIESLDGSVRFVHDKKRAEKRLLPASTFKILHSLIALDEEIMTSPDQSIKWDGVDRGWTMWNRDQTFKTAFRVSCVWCYVGFTKSLKNEDYLSHLKASAYGNQKTGQDKSNFWLSGDLAISAVEQIAFLRSLYNEKLPFERADQQIVKDFMFREKKSGAVLFSKTGWAAQTTPQHVWNVGFVERPDGVWLFAMNFDLRDRRQGKLRNSIAKNALAEAGLW